MNVSRIASVGAYVVKTTSCYSDGTYSTYQYAKKVGLKDLAAYMKEQGLK